MPATVAYPLAVWRPLPEANAQPLLVPIQVILHTVVGAGSPFGGFARADNPKESHLWLSNDALWEQYISLHRTADANYHANPWAISVETADDGTPADTPWTPAQCEELSRFLAWCNDPEGFAVAFQAATGLPCSPIPLVLCKSPMSPGVGWHAMWGAPSEWTPVPGKICPGPVRIEQIPGIIQRAIELRHPQEEIVYFARRKAEDGGEQDTRIYVTNDVWKERMVTGDDWDQKADDLKLPRGVFKDVDAGKVNRMATIGIDP